MHTLAFTAIAPSFIPRTREDGDSRPLSVDGEQEALGFEARGWAGGGKLLAWGHPSLKCQRHGPPSLLLKRFQTQNLGTFQVCAKGEQSRSNNSPVEVTKAC